MEKFNNSPLTNKERLEWKEEQFERVKSVAKDYIIRGKVDEAKKVMDDFILSYESDPLPRVAF